jgi:hypothetical protein
VSQQINLFNPIFLRQKRHFSALAMVQALVLVLLGALAMYAYQARQNRVLAEVLAQTEKDLSTRREQLARFGKEFSALGASKVLVEELAAAEARLAGRRALLADLKTGVGGDTQGYSRYLAALARQSMPGVWLTGIEIGGRANALLIRGRALESALVPAYIRALSGEEPIAGRPVAELQVAARRTERSEEPKDAPKSPERFLEFSLSIPLKGGQS